MAIEDGYELALTLSEAAASTRAGGQLDMESALQSYQAVRTRRGCHPPAFRRCCTPVSACTD